MATVTAEEVRGGEVLGIRSRASSTDPEPLPRADQEWHPDVSRNDPAESHEMTMRLKEAYDLLVDTA